MALGSSNPTTNLVKVANNDVNVGNGIADIGTQRVVLASDQSIIPVYATQAVATLTGVQITSSSGAFSCTSVSSPILAVGVPVIITGTNIGTGNITGYPTTSVYKISVTNGSTTFTLTKLDGSAVTTSVGTPSGLTFTLNAAQYINNLAQLGGQTIAMGTGVRTVGTQRVTIATDDIVPASQSGTWNINALTSITNALPTGANTIGKVDLNSGNNIIGKTYITDGIKDITIKAGSTQAQVSDTAVVVAFSPNTALPVGTNSIGKLGVNTGVIIGAVEIAASQTLNNLAQLGGQAIAMGTGARTAGTLRVTIATDDIVPASQSGTWTVQPGNIANNTPWKIVPSDGTNDTSVKAAGVTAQVSDPSLVVALSPNSPLPNGTNAIGTVELGATSLAALENISVTVPGTVDLGTISLTALETITVIPTSPTVGPNSNATSTALSSALQVKPNAGTLFMLTGYNSKISNQFIQIHNATSVTPGSVPVITFVVPGQSNFSFDFGTYGRYFSAGIYVVNSTTVATYTVGSADCWYDAQYK